MITVITPCRVARDILPATRDTLKAFAGAGMRVVARAGCSHLERKRSMLLAECLADGASAVLFWDSDVVARDPVEVIDSCYARERWDGVTGFCYPQKSARAGAFGGGGESPGRYFPTAWIGGGAMLIPAAVAGAVAAGLPQLLDQDRSAPFWPYFHSIVGSIEGQGVWLGEDVSFCARVRQAGLSVEADRVPVLGHYALSEDRIRWTGELGVM